jgi:hypothetical protein
MNTNKKKRLLVAGCWLLVAGEEKRASLPATSNQQPTTNNQQPLSNSCSFVSIRGCISLPLFER